MHEPLKQDELRLPQGPNINDDEIDLGQLVAVLVDAKWLIAAITAACVILGVIYALTATPIYQSDALLQIEQKESSIGGLDQLSGMFAGETPAGAEIEIIRSRKILGQTVDNQKLDIHARPDYFPLIGETLARRYGGEGPAGAFLGLDGYAWGGESIQVQRLDLSADYQGRPLTLIAGEAGRYRLLGPEEEPLLRGQVDQRATGNGIELFVAELTARPGTRFILSKQPRQQAIRRLQSNLTISEQGQKSGILRLTLEGADPQRLAETLDGVASTYLRQNVERRSAEAEKTLAFLNEQLPQLKADLNAAETRLNEYRSNLGSVDLTLETQGVLERMANVEKALQELELKRSELKQKFTANHPALITLQEKREQLVAERDALNREIKQMPEEVQQSVRLTRDVKVANELYLLLLNKAQEMRVIKAGTIGNVRIIDPAIVPIEPIKPKKSLIVVLSLVLGVMLGMFTVFVIRFLNRGVEDPDLIEQQLGIPVYAAVPHSVKQAREAKRVARKGKRRAWLLAANEPDDPVVESLRSLRTSLQFALMDAGNNIMAMTGPSPGLGKSFICANLAYVLAAAGKRTLLVDADLRKGHLHDYFGIERNEGLSGVISGEVALEQAVHKTMQENLDFLPAGIVPPNPSELLLNERLGKTLKSLSSEYDFVIIDTPPVLAVTDATIIARLAGINFVLLRSGVHPLREIEQTIKRLHQNGIKVQGFVFNDLPVRAGGYGSASKYAYHYQYEYK
ncbi:polysaccharide biosynthesis tyrosine autokinase [Thiohalophilus sp.]|uniref:polysaccharide biosynthesis tyrosine autokinase n=1 Tax=Thiohalophilus sp. TaxID=3028392 RepID=UPI002ACEC246|nr:polysaccharide biosynthesis tyrosine autokinase [Thiohalophilus sp.]MDZ7662788.1 polysaccharide biosynthesis tyrosine autokinase [Thiohalophilus sp.]